MANKEQSIPEPPALLPASLRAKWLEDYSRALARADADRSMDEMSRRQSALMEANRVLHVKMPESYAEAKALADWQCIRREDVGGVIVGLTIDGKKFKFHEPTATN